MHRASRHVAIIAVVFLVLPGEVLAGELDAFEKSAKKEKKRDDRGRKGDQEITIGDDTEAELEDLLLKAAGVAVLYGGLASWARVSEHDTGIDIEARELGEPLIPFARVDVSYQSVESDIDAYDYRIECGYGPLAVHFNQTDYRESSPSDELELMRIYGMCRMSFGSKVELDLGLGALTLDGNETDTRFSVTTPVLIHPAERIGLELRPAWAENFSDYDVALLLGWRYGSAKVGYRWVMSPDESLDGPYVGVSIHF